MTILAVLTLSMALTLATVPNGATAVARPLGGVEPPSVPGEFVVAAPAKSLNSSRFTSVLEVGFGWSLVRVPSADGVSQRSLAEEIERLTGFAAEPNYLYQLADEPLFPDQWGLENTGQTGGTTDADIDILDAWTRTTGKPEVTIAVLDTGAKLDHPDIEPVLWTNVGEIPGNGVDDDGNGFVDDVNGWDPLDGDSDPSDSDGHGTFVASVAVGAVNGVGIAGVAPDSVVMPIRVCDGFGCPLSAIIAGLSYAVANGADVANMSFGGNFSGTGALRDAVEGTAAAGVTLVAAAGNFGRNNDLLPFHPASFEVDGLISVAATDHDDNLASFSNFGATSVDLAAPGVDIPGAWFPGGWAVGSGTSFSAPHVTGVAALVKSIRSQATPSEVMDILLDSVDVISGLAGKMVTGGRLNAATAVELASYPIAVATVSPSSGTLPFTVDLDGSGSYDPLGEIVQWSWKLPDGSTVEEIETEWTATTSGQQTVTLTVTDDDGFSDEMKVTIEVNAPPVAAGLVTPTLGEVPLTVVASAKASSDPDDAITNWLWSYASTTVSGEEVNLLLEEIGISDVTLTVTDDFGASSAIGFQVLVGADFEDTDGSVFHDSITWLSAMGITKGCNPPVNDRFCPNDFVTRGQMAAFLVRAMGYTDDGGGNLFIDDDGNIFEGAIDKLGTAGVTRGCNPPVNNQFCPNDNVTRGQMAAFLVRALGYTDNGGGDLFVDDDGNTFENDIDKLGTAGVTKGCNPPVNNKFCPDDFVTRGQMAAFLHRALG